jgi:hypothetical protein
LDDAGGPVSSPRRGGQSPRGRGCGGTVGPITEEPRHRKQTSIPWPGNTGVDFGRAQGLGLIVPPPGPDQASGEAGTELVDRIGGERQGGGWLPGPSEER